MSTITYHDLDKSCSSTVFHGIGMEDGVPVDLDDPTLGLNDEKKKEILEMAKANKFFAIDEPAGKKAPPPKVEETHAKADTHVAASKK